MPYNQIYEPMARSPRTELDGAIDSSVTTFSVINGALLPPAPNTATIGLGEDSETVLYETLIGNILSDITRGFDPPGSQKGWDSGTPIARVLVKQDLVALKENIDNLDSEVEKINNDLISGLSITRSGKDIYGIFVTVVWKREDNTTYKDSVLSGGTAPEYATRTIKYYAEDGVTVIRTVVFTLSYDGDDDLISEVIV